jgi:hypothetical protein
MNWKLAEKINKIKGLTAVQRSILFALAGYANDKNQCFPSHQTLALTACVSKRALINNVKELENMKILWVDRLEGGPQNSTNLYTILVEVDKKEDNFRGEADALEVSFRGAADALGGCSRCTGGGAADAHRSRYTRTDTITDKKHTKKENAKTDEEKKEITEKVNLELKLKFSVFWDLYLKKRNKKAAQKKFEAIVSKKLHIADEIIAGTRKHVQRWKSQNTKLQFIPYPETFLNKGAYADEFDAEKNNDIWSKYL